MPRNNEDMAPIIEALRNEIGPLKTDLAVVKQQVQSMTEAQKNMYSKDILDQRFQAIEDTLKQTSASREALWFKLSAGVGAVWIILQALPSLIHAFQH